MKPRRLGKRSWLRAGARPDPGGHRSRAGKWSMVIIIVALRSDDYGDDLERASVWPVGRYGTGPLSATSPSDCRTGSWF
jgi:hypothetical protein